MTITVFISAIHQEAGEKPLITATNGMMGGPPAFEFNVTPDKVTDLRIGQRITLTLEFGPVK